MCWLWRILSAPCAVCSARIFRHSTIPFLAALVGLVPPVIAQAPPDVLIINSYHPGYAWSDGEMRGLLKSLLRESPQLLPAIEYLDWKRQPTTEQERQFVEMLRLKYSSLKLRAVVTLDDKAFELALSQRDILGGAAIVFGGVNYFDTRIAGTGPYTNLTGAVESKDISRTLWMIQRLQPNVREIVGFHDNTESSLANRRALEEAITNTTPRLTCRFIENWSTEELFTALSQLKRHSVAVSLGSTRDREGVLLADDADYLRTVVERCSVPIYLISEPIVPLFSAGGWDSAIWAGVGGCLASSDLHGEVVGDLANRVLRGQKPESIPIVTNSPVRMAVDWRQMKRFNLPFSALPEGTEIFNQPESFYQVHKSRILLVLAALLALSVTVVILATNIILRRRAEQESARLAAAVSQTADMVIMLDAAGTVTYVNPAFTRMTGCALDAVRSNPEKCLQFGPEGQSGFSQIVAKLRENATWTEQKDYHAPDGSTLRLAFVGSMVRDSRGITGYILIARDVTRETKLEEQVRMSQKMEAVGLLAGGVAHDFNNLLQIIIGYGHLALREDQPAGERTSHVQQVLKAAERASQLPRQLLAFGRKQAMTMQDTDMNSLVSGFLKMIRRLIGEDVEVDFIPGHHLGNVRADHGQLEQVILNLCVNARDAMPNGGKLTIELENVSVNGAYCEAHPWAKPGRHVLLSVTDSGCGMDRTTLARIFDPFFTTKPAGKGTGLGLAVVYGIIQQHEGFIHVYSEPDRGTTFKIYLPVVEKRAEEVGNKLLSHAPGPASGTILLVEDEVTVRTLAERILRQAGYRVLLSENGADAVQVFETHASEIQLVVMDVVMPKMNGPESAKRMRGIRNGIPILFCSGYSADTLNPKGDFGADAQLLHKPYDPGELLARVAAMIQGKG